MKNKILILAGDPNSINSEIISKVWKKSSISTKNKLFLIANYNLMNEQFKKLKSSISLIKIRKLNDKLQTKKLKVIDIPLKFKDPFNVSLKNSKQYIIRSLNLAHKMAERNEVKGFINCPIDKKLLGDSKKSGVTEFLASKCKVNKGSEVMFIHNKKLSVVPLTTHVNINKVSKKLNTDLIIKKMNTLQKQFIKLFKKKPKIGIMGLNPHNAEFTKNSEEVKIIIPAISKLKRENFHINGPLSPDTLFINNYKKYDVIVGMYHDQVLVPFKTLFKFDGINITLGLKYLRVSPDHGPAKDIIKKNRANYLSLLSSIKFFNKFT